MEKLIKIMLVMGEDNSEEAYLANKIHLKDESKDIYINFCMRCFKGHF